MLTEELKPLEPFYNIPTTAKPYDVGDFLSLLPPGNTVIGNYLADKTENPELDTIVNKINFVS